MNWTKIQLWERFKKYYLELPTLGMAIDISRINFSDDFFAVMGPRMKKAFAAMDDLEKGAIANPDENRMVGHYWLRNPALAPTAEIRQQIEETQLAIKSFSDQIHNSTIRGQKGPFKNLVVIGIGGSALGPRFVASALGHPLTDKLRIHFLDNTDPDGFDNVLSSISGELGNTLCVVISKSGATKEPRNAMLEVKAAYEASELKFAAHSVAVTQTGSELDRYALKNKWLKRFPMWDWVGGRTSQTSAVGLLPASLQGFNVDELLDGAKACDDITRKPLINANPAALLALTWYYAGKGKGTKDMVILPYKDRLELFSRYLQQLVMESIGKGKNLLGKSVNQGIAVYGNKGSTDQHAYVQQLREGINNFFVTFIEVLRDRNGRSIMVEPNITSGDYLNGFFQGTRRALYENGRESITITLTEVSPYSTGSLIALYERAVGLYSSLINVNAYHQPGVEAGKKAAAGGIELQLKVLSALASAYNRLFTPEQIAEKIGASKDVETVFKICEHLAANPDRGVKKIRGAGPFLVHYCKI